METNKIYRSIYVAPIAPCYEKHNRPDIIRRYSRAKKKAGKEARKVMCQLYSLYSRYIQTVSVDRIYTVKYMYVFI